jgi:hypothetical protein
MRGLDPRIHVGRLDKSPVVKTWMAVSSTAMTPLLEHFPIILVRSQQRRRSFDIRRV